MSDSWETLIERLFKEHGKPLFAFIRGNMRNPHDAEDVYQEVLARMLGIAGTGEIKNLQGYMFTVARNLLIERTSEERRLRGSADIDDPAIQDRLVDTPDPGALVDFERRITRLREVLRNLPLRWLTAVVMCHMHGMSYQEAATRLGVSVNSIKKYLKKALARCRCEMAELR